MNLRCLHDSFHHKFVDSLSARSAKNMRLKRDIASTCVITTHTAWYHQALPIWSTLTISVALLSPLEVKWINCLFQLTTRNFSKLPFSKKSMTASPRVLFFKLTPPFF